MPTPVKFYMDENVHPAITSGLRLRNMDVLTAQDAGMLGATDEAHLTFAADEGRVIFSNDDDFLKFHAQSLAHPGIAFAHQRTPIGRVIRGLVLIGQVLSAEEMKNHVEFL